MHHVPRLFHAISSKIGVYLGVETHHVVIIANPRAGGGRARDVAIAAQEALSNSGLHVTLHLPTTREQLHRATARVCQTRPTIVLACGGDGTVHDVLQLTIESNTVLGIIPCGTGNDIARSLGLPGKTNQRFFQKLAHSILHHDFESIDASRISIEGKQQWSLGVISAGLDSDVNERANRMTHFRGTTRYILALLVELREFPLHNYTVTIDSTKRSGSAILIAVGNGGQYGGGMKICPQADMTDGLLDITWVDPAPRRTVLRLFPLIYSGRHVNSRLVHTYRGSEISIESPDSMIYADGERIGPTPALIQVVPKVARVLLFREQMSRRNSFHRPRESRS